MTELEKYIDECLNQKKLSNIAIRVGKNDKILTEYYKSDSATLDENTLFDIASVSKMVSTTQIALISIDKGLITLEDKVSKYFETDSELTIKHLLTHTIGIGWKNLCRDGVNSDNIAEYILSIPTDIPIGSGVLYSCPALILMGKLLEKVWGKSLDVLFDELVAKPLEFKRTTYMPIDTTNMVNANLTEDMKGKVNDNNCRHLGGVAGNAGLFSNISDLNKFCKMLINHGAPLHSKELFLESVKNYADGENESRAIGYVYGDSKYERYGNLFEEGSIGHGGWTGQLVFTDYRTGLYIIVLTDIAKCLEQYHGGVERAIVNEIISTICNIVKSMI